MAVVFRGGLSPNTGANAGHVHAEAGRQSARGSGTQMGCGKLDQVEIKPLPTLRIALGISLYSG